MYDIKQFRPAMYVLVIMGIIGYSLAAESAGVGVLAITLVLVNAWYVSSGNFRPIPLWLASVISLAAFSYAFVFCYSALDSHVGNPILTIGQFLVVMQLVKLYEQRANRDFTQLLGLSLLLMVASAISTASFVFGLLLIAYLFMSMYCSLLFHLKIATDEARLAMSLPEERRLDIEGSRLDQRQLLHSVRRLAVLVFGCAIGCAVLIFLFFPRTANGRWLGQLQWRPQEAMTGLSDQVNFQQFAKIAQNNDEVGTVKVWRDGVAASGAQPLWLRGVTLDYYNGDDDTERAAYQWSRNAGGSSNTSPDLGLHQTWTVEDAVTAPQLRAEVSLNAATGSAVLPTLAGPTQLTLIHCGSGRHLSLQYCGVDESIEAADQLPPNTQYEFLATDSLGPPPDGSEHPNPFRRRSNIGDEIKALARRPEVSGLGLAERRRALVAARPRGTSPYIVTPVDEQIARNIERYLRSNYAYTLDLTDVGDLKGKDPVVAFLTDFKRGHCEYFAGAMTLLCQSLNMESRMVVGFVCDEYNSFGQFYTIRQSQAHAWVEVLTPAGWERFDPTSGHEADPLKVTTLQKAKRFFDYLEYTWANAVIAYDADNRDTLIHEVQRKATRAVTDPSVPLTRLRTLLERLAEWLATTFVGPMIGLLGIVLVAAIGWYMFERWRLFQLANRIGIESLPTAEQQRLARQLAFYDELIQSLEKHQIVRPKHLTPMEFSESLAYLPADVYDAVRRLTALFYRIRYGNIALPAGQHRHLENAVHRVDAALHQLAPPRGRAARRRVPAL